MTSSELRRKYRREWMRRHRVVGERFYKRGMAGNSITKRWKVIVRMFLGL